MTENTMPSEIDFFVAYSNAKNEDDKERIKKEYEEKMEAYMKNPDKVIHILD